MIARAGFPVKLREHVLAATLARGYGVHPSVSMDKLLPSPTSEYSGSCATKPRAFDVRKDAHASTHADVISEKARVADDD